MAPRKNEISVWAPEANRVELDGATPKTHAQIHERLVVWSASPRHSGLCVCCGRRHSATGSAIGLAAERSAGRSRLVDHGVFEWTDQSWQSPPLSAASVYELHIGTFTEEGTFDATIRRIPYLLDLGVTHVELMPVNEFPGDWGWGYNGVDLYAPHHAYGGPEGLKRLVDARHANGLAAILDVVYNH